MVVAPPQKLWQRGLVVTLSTIAAAAPVAMWAIHCWLVKAPPRGAIQLAAAASRKTLDTCLPQCLRSSLGRCSAPTSPRSSATADDLAAAWAAAAAAASSAGSSKPGWSESPESSEDLDKFGSMKEGLGRCQLAQSQSLTWQPEGERDYSLPIEAIGSLGEGPGGGGCSTQDLSSAASRYNGFRVKENVSTAAVCSC